MGRPGRDAPRPLSHHHCPCRPSDGTPQPTVQPCAKEDRGDQPSAGLHARVGRRARGLAKRTRGAGEAGARFPGDHDVHRRGALQFRPYHAPDLADHAAGDHRRHDRAARHGIPIRLHGPAGNPRPGRRVNQESNRRAEQDHQRNQCREVALPGDSGRMHQQAAAGVHGRADDGPWQHPVAPGPVLRGDGGVHHLRPDLRRHSVVDRDARALRHDLPHSRGACAVRVSKAVLLLLFLLLPGCMVGPNYRRPSVNPPTDLRGVAPQQDSLADLPWWEIFKDDTLKNLVKSALANNYDLAAATARVEQAHQVAAQAKSEYFPNLNYSSILSYGHNQFLQSPSSNAPGAQGFFLGVVSATWEADVWGRIRRMNEAARAEYLATDEARRGVMLTLVSDVSQAYFELLGLRLQLEIARETAQSYTQTVNLFTERLQGGIGNALQTSRAAADLATAAASIPEMERLIGLKENQISVLIGQNPGAIETKVKLLEEVIPLDIPAGLPSALLERRPDVLSAAQTVRAANAQIGVAQSAFFPAIGLTTFFGKLSTPLSELSSGNTNAWSLASNFSGPIFHFGGLKARKREAIANWEQATAQYRQTALNAFRDVSDALISRENYEAIRGELIHGVQANQEAVKLARMRYLEGLSSYVEVLDALQRLYPAQTALAQTEVNRRLVIIQLYKALGGGWNLTDSEFMTACCSPVVQGNQP